MTLAKRLKSSVSNLAQGVVGVAAGLALVFAIAGAPAQAWAQVAPAPAAAPAATPAIQGQGPALWVIKDADSTLYLFGTVHVLRPTVGWLSPKVEAAFDSSDQIWFEFSNPDDQAAVMAVIQQHGYSSDRPLSSYLTADERIGLEAAAASIGVAAEAMEPMRPWWAGMTLALAPLAKAGYDPMSGSERILKARADAAGKPSHGFETIEQQVRVLADLPEAVQVDLVREGITDYQRGAEMLDGLVDAWAKGDVKALEAITVAEMKADFPALYGPLIVDRNTDWADQIQTQLQGSGTAFIAVGAAHLTGDDSVQSILKSRGVAVESVE
ncbi:MAG: TraB/GumN family protein [Alphaproteobacteria bacterium]|uniref:TraB/GumN family protein n=1 Tax=Brevundimonas sp. TaxID=1871086 RepID=UPI001E055408|nr:TraB/GumN family protein [Alphaproteobacteria bacterium]MBU1521097.1 TraB/GumN family protein [Alphaproteobacteria bacterium]MBU2030487.1 TraB/GumN family protein [Alphaproteobacteria bacterium]MBU2165655.1 TraB/GumN family protein [Alphaproteobacteria bacterium]MBU2231389.1 TraB/GumN family protein [Alphaproteobacteria bacterium]